MIAQWLRKAEFPCIALMARHPGWINGIDKCNAYIVLRGRYRGTEVYDDDLKLLSKIANEAARYERRKHARHR